MSLTEVSQMNVEDMPTIMGKTFAEFFTFQQKFPSSRVDYHYQKTDLRVESRVATQLKT